MTISLQTLQGGTTDIAAEDVEALRAGLRGPAPAEGEPGYEDARTIWNGMVDRKPGLVIRAMGTSDIRAAVNFARAQGVLMSVRAGGHQIAGHAVIDGALLLDLSQMRSVHVEPEARRARVDPGCLLSDVDQETQVHALALPVGVNSTTGIAGLTLGGGFGWITRKYGLTIDNLISAEVVTADGTILTASETDNPDLFWAIRGGGGNFGVVSSFEFALHPVGPQVMSGLIVHPMDSAPEVLRGFRRICNDAPDDLTVWAVMRKAPPLPFLPEEWHGREVLILAACYAGDMEEGETAMRDLRGLGEPIADVISPHPYTGWQAAFDPLLTPGARNYWKSHDFTELSDEALDLIVNSVGSLPDSQSEIFIAHVGGAMARVAPEATAFPQRDAHFTMNVHTRWNDPAKDDTCIQWARDLFDRTAPHAAGTVYVNFMPADETARLAGAYGPNMARLREVKARYDPDNLFRANHNIPASALEAAAQ